MLAELLMSAALVQDPPAPPRKTPPPLPVPVGQGAPAGQGGEAAAPAPDPAPPSPAAGTLPEIRNVFLLGFDANGDGFLAPAELPRRLAKKFASADANHDGALDAAEILHDGGPIGKEARKADGLELDGRGKLQAAGAGGAKPKFGEIAKAVLQQSDIDGDGRLTGREIGGMFRNIILPQAREKIADAIRGKRPEPAEQGSPAAEPPAGAGAPMPMPMPMPAGQGSTPADPPAPIPASASAEPMPPAPLPKQGAPKGAGGYPTPAEIIAALDKNGDGMVGEAEAVDQLAKNFKMIDKDRNGKLDAKELDASLKLAKLLGIKMDKPPSEYAPKPAPKQ